MKRDKTYSKSDILLAMRDANKIIKDSVETWEEERALKNTVITTVDCYEHAFLRMLGVE